LYELFFLLFYKQSEKLTKLLQQVRSIQKLVGGEKPADYSKPQVADGQSFLCSVFKKYDAVNAND